MSAKTIHIAAENPHVRQSLRNTVKSYGIADIVEVSVEGAEGTERVEQTDPHILLLSTGEDEDTAKHVGWYRDVAPHAYIIGFAFNEDEAKALVSGGVDVVAMSDAGRSKFLEILRQAERQA